ncbi:MAG TPA: ribulose-phosphate 3-epimerase [Candidatus Babeliales bacterium]|nr:ribulose-phosphate 3-epimerase [Candidatus Babeliales bacterium]
MVRIYPSLMAANQLRLEDEIRQLEPYCAGFHLDVMDYHFVPNITWGAGTINAIAKISRKIIWLHLMVDDPISFYETLFLPEGSLVSFHIESNIDIFYFIKIIKEKKHRVGLAIKPKTPIIYVFPFLNIINQVLLMSVEPGFSGQSFLDESMDRLIQLAEYRKNHTIDFKIGIDGGINMDNIVNLVQNGADDCAIATSIFHHENHIVALKQLNKLAVK